MCDQNLVDLQRQICAARRHRMRWSLTPWRSLRISHLAPRGSPRQGHMAPWVPEANGPGTLQHPRPGTPRGFPSQTLRANIRQTSATDTHDLPSTSKSVPQVGNVALVLLHTCTRKRAGTSLGLAQRRLRLQERPDAF